VFAENAQLKHFDENSLNYLFQLREKLFSQNEGESIVSYFKENLNLFSDKKCESLLHKAFLENGITENFGHQLIGVSQKKATFLNKLNSKIMTQEFDFLHFIPTFRLPSYFDQSGL
jgi:hypothetical protein